MEFPSEESSQQQEEEKQTTEEETNSKQETENVQEETLQQPTSTTGATPRNMEEQTTDEETSSKKQCVVAGTTPATSTISTQHNMMSLFDIGDGHPLLRKVLGCLDIPDLARLEEVGDRQLKDLASQVSTERIETILEGKLENHWRLEERMPILSLKYRWRRWTEAVRYAERMEQVAEQHYDYDNENNFTMQPKCRGCSDMPDLDTQHLEDSDHDMAVDFFVRLSYRKFDRQKQGGRPLESQICQGFFRPYPDYPDDYDYEEICQRFFRPYPDDPDDYDYEESRRSHNAIEGCFSTLDLRQFDLSHVDWPEMKNLFDFQERNKNIHVRDGESLVKKAMDSIALTVVAMIRDQPWNCSLILATGGYGGTHLTYHATKNLYTIFQERAERSHDKSKAVDHAWYENRVKAELMIDDRKLQCLTLGDYD